MCAPEKIEGLDAWARRFEEGDLKGEQFIVHDPETDRMTAFEKYDDGSMSKVLTLPTLRVETLPDDYYHVGIREERDDADILERMGLREAVPA